jgi:ABC-2 type transport system permease protein
VIFLAVVQHAGRPDLTGYAVLAPMLLTLWYTSLFIAGEIIDSDRWFGTLEPVIASPAAFPLVVLGRIMAVTALSLLAVPETLAVARFGFGVRLAIHHPAVLALTILATVMAMAGTAVCMSGLFVLTRTARTFQNSASYPFYLLGGVIVPVALLPAWVRPLSRLVFLSWSSDLLRATLRPGPVEQLAPRLGAILLLGAAGFVVGGLLLRTVLRRVRELGTLPLA